VGRYTGPVSEASNRLPGPWIHDRVRVRYGETDQMGHAYYGSTLLWFEQARSAACRALGMPYKQIEAQGFRLPVVEVHVVYKSEVKYDDVLDVRIRVAELRRASVRFDYEVWNEESPRLCTTGFTWHVLVGANMKAVTFPPFLRALLTSVPTPSR